MKMLNRNKVEFYYALYEGRFPVLNASGKPTGEYELRYSNPVQAFANISAAKGETQSRQFGESVDYDKVIVSDLATSIFDEYSVLWVDRMPLLDENGALAIDDDEEVITSHDYIVKKVARSLNSVTYAISKVNVSGG